MASTKDVAELRHAVGEMQDAGLDGESQSDENSMVLDDDDAERDVVARLPDLDFFDKFAVHGLFYWLTIGFVVILSIGRAFWVVWQWWSSPSIAFPRELYAYLGVAAVFPPFIHVVAANAEVRLNAKRRLRYVDKIA